MNGFPLEVDISWLGLLALFVPALAISAFARRVSGSWKASWLSMSPRAWFAFLFVVPPLGYTLLVVNLFVYRRRPGAITGRTHEVQTS